MTAFTKRTTQVLDRVIEGKTNKAIAGELSITEGTVKSYLNRIYRKYYFKNRTEAAMWYIKNKQESLFK